MQLVVNNDAGVYVPNPEKVADTVAQWLSEGEERLAERAENARRIAYPNAVWDIAESVWEWAHKPSIITSRVS